MVLEKTLESPLDCSAEHSEVALVTPLSILLSGGEEDGAPANFNLWGEEEVRLPFAKCSFASRNKPLPTRELFCYRSET